MCLNIIVVFVVVLLWGACLLSVDTHGLGQGQVRIQTRLQFDVQDHSQDVNFTLEPVELSLHSIQCSTCTCVGGVERNHEPNFDLN